MSIRAAITFGAIGFGIALVGGVPLSTALLCGLFSGGIGGLLSALPPVHNRYTVFQTRVQPHFTGWYNNGMTHIRRYSPFRGYAPQPTHFAPPPSHYNAPPPVIKKTTYFPTKSSSTVATPSTKLPGATYVQTSNSGEKRVTHTNPGSTPVQPPFGPHMPHNFRVVKIKR